MSQVFSEQEWLQRLLAEKVCKKDMDKLIMNYFVVEGYKDAAEHFAQESNTDIDSDLNSIGDRMEIRSAIEKGDVDSAMERVNDLNPEILETNPTLYFHLQQQRLIELIRQGKVKEALDFVQEELPPLCEESPHLLDELETTLALLAFQSASSPPSDPSQPQQPPAPPPPESIAHLVEPLQRQKTASEVNAAILTSQARDKESKLPVLLKMLVWAQMQLSEHASCPSITNMLTGELSCPRPQSVGAESSPSSAMRDVQQHGADYEEGGVDTGAGGGAGGGEVAVVLDDRDDDDDDPRY